MTAAAAVRTKTSTVRWQRQRRQSLQPLQMRQPQTTAARYASWHYANVLRWCVVDMYSSVKGVQAELQSLPNKFRVAIAIFCPDVRSRLVLYCNCIVVWMLMVFRCQVSRFQSLCLLPVVHVVTAAWVISITLIWFTPSYKCCSSTQTRSGACSAFAYEASRHQCSHRRSSICHV